MEKKKINAKIIADSIDIRGNRITSYILTYPRFIHSELMTHRMFSRNAASSRAIPFKKMVKMVEDDPFIPIAWQKDHTGMQGVEYWTKEDMYPVPGKSYVISANTHFTNEWLAARDSAILSADHMSAMKLTKQLCNRLLEPFMWYTVLVTATEYDNFFNLRTPSYYYEADNKTFNSKKDFIYEYGGTIHDYSEEYWRKINSSQAEIHIQALAEAMWDARNESTPKELEPGQWHIPFGDRILEDDILPILYKINAKPDSLSNYKIKIATARAARLSYMTFDGEIDVEKDIKLHDQLLASKHMSPFEHVARCMTEEEYRHFSKGLAYIKGHGGTQEYGWCNNFRGFIPYRYIIEQ